MALEKFPVVLVVLTFLWTFTSGDTDVLCVVSNSCILPCSFRYGADLVIHWVYLKQDVPVHSYYHNQDQLGYQGNQFRTRTSLYQNQISRGNSSLLLTGVKVQDEGRYKCYTSTITENMESFISLRVHAPVGKVNIHQDEKLITCSSEGIYPQPELTWSPTPPSDTHSPSTPTIRLTDEKLYNINSSLLLPDTPHDLDYSCTITTQTSSGRATLFKQNSMTGSDFQTTIPCSESKSHHSGLVWRYNHSQIILTQSGAESSYKVTEQWRQHVKSVSESGSLTLTGLSSSHDGVYTCELTNDKETYISNTLVGIESDKSGIISGVVVAVVVVVVIALIIGAVLWRRQKKKDQRRHRTNMNGDHSKETTEEACLERLRT